MRFQSGALALLLALGLYSIAPAHAQVANNIGSCNTQTLPTGNQQLTMNSGGNLCVNASVTATATISGFTAATTGTPIAVTTSSSTGTLPAGAEVVATNVGTTNGAYCALGATATTASQYIAPNGGWFAFTVGGSTQLSCITSAGTTTVNTSGGAGLPTGTGGGGGSGGGGGAVTMASGAVASGAYAAGSLAAGAGVDGWDLTQGTKADAAWVSGSGSVVSILKNIAGGIIAAIPAGTNVIGKVGIDQTTPGTTNGAAVVGVNGATALAGNGTTGTGSLRVTIASDNSAIAGAGVGATGSAVPANAVSNGVNAQSAEPTKATTGNLTAVMGDLTGKVVTSPYANRENMVRGSATGTDTAAHTIIAAGGASVKTYITDVECGRSDAGTAAIIVTLSDSASTILVLPNSGGGGGNNKTFNVPLVTAANTAFTFTAGTGTTTVYCSAQGFTGY